MTSWTSVRSGRRWLIVFLVALVAGVMAGGSGLIIAPPAHASGGQNRVRAQDLVGGTQLQDSALVAVYAYDATPTSTTSPVSVVFSTAVGGAPTPSGFSGLAAVVSRSFVAAEAGGGGGDVAFGPAPENAWNTFERVESKVSGPPLFGPAQVVRLGLVLVRVRGRWPSCCVRVAWC